MELQNPLTWFALLQLADLLTTRRILALGGRELNPLVRRAMDVLGVVPGLLAAKCAAILMFMLAQQFQWGLVALYVLVVASNTRVMRRLATQPE